MIDSLLVNIQEHMAMLDLALKSSEQIRNFAKEENLDGITLETENRERLVNIVTQIQQKVEDKINQLNAAEINQEGILILKSWFQDLNNWSEKMLAFDRETVELLAQQKENTTKEIALIFTNKELFKGYNHGLKK